MRSRCLSPTDRRYGSIEIDGKTRTLAEWCRVQGCYYQRAYRRIKSGWNPIDAIMKPKQH